MHVSENIPAPSARYSFIDVLKGIGILSVVVGHAFNESIFGLDFLPRQFVYLYNLMVFFFAAGFCFSREKARTPAVYIGKRLKSLWVLYIGYGTLCVLLHNLLVMFRLVDAGQPFYDLQTSITAFFGTVAFQCPETMAGALWFVPVFFFATAFFCMLFYIAERFKKPLPVHLVFCMAAMLLGIYLNQIDVFVIPFHMQTSVLALPVLYLGYTAKCYWSKIEKLFTWYTGILAGAVAFASLWLGEIELSRNQIIHPLLFYPVTLCGIWFCLGLARFFCKAAWLRRPFSYMGKNSFSIMALHFLTFKMIDFIYGHLAGKELSLLAGFPISFAELWWLYIPLGVAAPLVFVALLKKIKLFFMKHIEKNFLKESECLHV